MGKTIYAFQKVIGTNEFDYENSVISWNENERFLSLLLENGTLLHEDSLSLHCISLNQQQLNHILSICKDIYHVEHFACTDETEDTIKESWRYILKTLGLLQTTVNWDKEHVIVSVRA